MPEDALATAAVPAVDRDDGWSWFCSSCGHEWPPEPPRTAPTATRDVERDRGGWLSRVRERVGPVEAAAETPPPVEDEPSYGDRLRAARDATGRSVPDVAAATGIWERYLQALESGAAPDAFPAAAYARFFLREYAEHLGLDARALLASFDRRYPPEPEVEEAPRASLPERHPRRRIAATVLVGASVLALITMAAVAGSRSHPNGGGPLSAPASVLDGASTPSGSPSPASPAPEVARHIRAVLDFDAPCWVRAVSDGRTIVERTIAAGQRLVVRGDRRVDLVLGNAGGVTLEVNGEAVRTGSSGDVTTLSLRLRDGAVVTR